MERLSVSYDYDDFQPLAVFKKGLFPPKMFDWVRNTPLMTKSLDLSSKKLMFHFHVLSYADFVALFVALSVALFVALRICKFYLKICFISP